IRRCDDGSEASSMPRGHSTAIPRLSRSSPWASDPTRRWVRDVIDTKVFISMFVAYVGLDPEKDINWVTVPNWDDQIPLLQQGKIDAFFAGPPGTLEMRQKGIGHVLVSTTTDKPWSQYACCLVASTKEFVRKNPVATKRALR